MHGEKKKKKKNFRDVFYFPEEYEYEKKVKIPITFLDIRRRNTKRVGTEIKRE